VRKTNVQRSLALVKPDLNDENYKELTLTASVDGSRERGGKV